MYLVVGNAKHYGPTTTSARLGTAEIWGMNDYGRGKKIYAVCKLQNTKIKSILTTKEEVFKEQYWMQSICSFYFLLRYN